MARRKPPPAAAKRPHTHRLHGDAREDPWFWLRNAGDPAVLEYLKEENRHTEAQTAHTKKLREKLYREMLSHIAEDDSSAPYPKGGFLYYTRTEKGRPHRIHCRRRAVDGAGEEILLDVNALAAGKKFCEVGVVEVSPDHRVLAWSVDYRGDELYELHFTDLATGNALGDSVPGTCDSAAFAGDGRTVFYTVPDHTHRPYRLYRRAVDGRRGDAELVYEESDPAFYLSVSRSASGAFVFVDLHSKNTSEVLAITAGRPHSAPRAVLRREAGVEYHAEHCGGFFYLLSNKNARNFQLLKLPLAGGAPAAVIPHRDDVTLEDFFPFASHLAVLERHDGLPRVFLCDHRGGGFHLSFDEEVYDLSAEHNEEFNSKVFRLRFTSPVTPHTVLQCDMDSGKKTVLKRTPVPGGFRPEDYRARREFAVAEDGARIPITLVHRAGLARGAPQPLLLAGYGAYGLNYPPHFRAALLPLLRRGLVFAIAHVRGGGEMGRRWYDEGKLLHKRNTFTDFIACAEYLVEKKWTAPAQLAISGGSAGGLLIGAVLNMRPQLFRAAVANVPFVDVLSTILDDSLPLSATERDEWGDPREKKFYDYIKSYSPYDNTAFAARPDILITAGLNDPRVAYWEPAKWANRLRETGAGGGEVLLKTTLHAGHGGASGRYARLRETALEHTFIAERLNLVARDGIEPPTRGFSVPCSTD